MNPACEKCGMLFGTYENFTNHQRGCRKRQINDPLVNKRVVLGSGSIDVNHVPLDENDRDYDSEEEPEMVLVPLIDEVPNFTITKYGLLQIELYRTTYGEASLYADNPKSFVKQCQNKIVSMKSTNDMILSNWIKDNGISDSAAQELLNIIADLEPKHPFPTQIRSLKRRMNKLSKPEMDNIEEILWPQHWNMHLLNNAPETITVRAIDPLEYIAYMLVDPILMFSWKNHIHLKPFTTEYEGSRYYNDFMSAGWAHETYKDLVIRTGNKDAILIPFIPYWDGVSVGHFTSQSHVKAALGTLGIFSDQLMQKNIAKFSLGYIPELENIDKSELVKHLMDKCSMSKAKALEEIHMFELHIDRSFWVAVFRSVTAAWQDGVEMYVLGLGWRKIYVAIPFPIGDDPALHRLLMAFEANCHHACLTCMYPTRTGVKYDPALHVLRNAEWTHENQYRGEGYRIKRISDRLTAAERNVLSELEGASLHAMRCPLSEVPMGSNNTIHDVGSCLLHVWPGGIVKSALLNSMTILVEISKDVSGLYSSNVATFNARLRSFPFLAKLPHIRWTYFRKKGLTRLVQGSSVSDKTKSTGGTGGGYRSSDFISALMQVYVVIGYDGILLPNSRNFNFQKKNSPMITVGNVTEIVMQALACILSKLFGTLDLFTES
jgi:hypothetical protein